jgi:hypothetical protein
MATTLTSSIIWKLTCEACIIATTVINPIITETVINAVHTMMFVNLAKKPLHSEETKNKIYCEKCNRYCFRHDCFNNHHDVCKEVYKCKVCYKITLRTRTHMCG